MKNQIKIGGKETTVERKVNVAPMLEAACGVKTCPIYVRELERESYPIKTDDMWKNWFMFAFKAFKKMQGTKIRSFATLGTGPGIDAIGASVIFENLAQLVITDIDMKIINLAKENVLLNLGGKNIELVELCGSLCTPLEENGIKVDLIYENLPNIPEATQIINNRMAASFFNPTSVQMATAQEVEALTEIAEKYLLMTHFAVWNSAKDCLDRNGSVISSIGGRVPYSIFIKLVEGSGYLFSELAAGFKVQTEPEEVIGGYARLEQKNGVNFEFYKYAEAIELLHGAGVTYPFAHENGAELKDIIEKAKVNANEAKNLSRNNILIGHTVHMIRAQKQG